MDELHTGPELWGGIECTINRVHNTYFDQLASSGHYKRWADIDEFIKLGIQKIRYPVLWEKHQPQQHTSIDWSWTTQGLQRLRDANVEVIAGLVHHGSGPAFTNLLDPNFPYLLAQYAETVARQFPWLKYYTPVNEPLTTARFSALYGIWYPHHTDDASFLKALLNQVKGVVLSMQAIRKVNPDAQLVQTEDLGKTYSTRPLRAQARFENRRRWLTYDLLCGKVNKKHPLWAYFIKHGITPEELDFFTASPCVPDVFGFNYYVTSERFLDGRVNRYPENTHGGNRLRRYADVEAIRSEVKEETGIKCLLKEAWQRYHQPIALTEVHLHCHREEQLRWFNYLWTACCELRTEGINIQAATAWALLGSYGWNSLLTGNDGVYEAGLFDVSSGSLRPTALSGFIASLNNHSHLHVLAGDKGWWQRSDRFFHRPKLLSNRVPAVPRGNPPILIIGKNGTLGRAFGTVCTRRALPHRLLGRQDCDICNLASIQSAIEIHKPWAIINAAGFVRVDDAQTEADRCRNENVWGAQNLALAAAAHGIKLVTFSSDLVFNGEKTTPYVETDATAPLNVYGQTKAEAERAVLEALPQAMVVRTSAFIGPWDEYNFAHFVRRSLLRSEHITVASDAVVSPTYVPDLVHACLDLLIDDESGIWHLANAGAITWADLAYEIAGRFRLSRKYIQPLPTSELNYPAKRPLYSVLSSSRGLLLPSLEAALTRYVNEAPALKRERVRTYRA